MKLMISTLILFIFMMLANCHLAWHLRKGDVSALDFIQAALTSISYIGVSYLWFTA